jgi:hypothetical protein
MILSVVILTLISMGAQAASWPTPACPAQFLAQLTPEARDFYATLDKTANSPQFESFMASLGFDHSEIFEELLGCDDHTLGMLKDSFSKPYPLSRYSRDSKTDINPRISNKETHGLSIYKGHWFISDYFARVGMNNPSGLGVLKQQAWIEWDRANKQFILHKAGAESFILRTEVKGALYRGASELEFAYLLGIKRLIQPRFDQTQLDFVTSAIGNIIVAWQIENPQVLNVFAYLETIAHSSLKQRTEAAKILISVVSRYPAIMLGTIRETAARWAFENRGYGNANIVEIFDIPSNTMTPKVFEGFYAGTEFSYFEIGFITPEARLFLVSHMRDEPFTRSKAEHEFPYLKNQ